MMTCAPELAQAAAAESYDYVALDMQHGLVRLEHLPGLIDAIRSVSNSEVVVRVPSNEFSVIGRVADMNIDGIIVPLVNNADDAQFAVQATVYPPTGQRSWGPTADLISRSAVLGNQGTEPYVLAMIETKEGLENLESICAVNGLHGVYIGPADLALQLGTTPDTELHCNTVEKVRRTATDHGLVTGIHCSNGDEASKRRKQGFTFITSSSDIGSARAAYKHDLKLATLSSNH